MLRQLSGDSPTVERRGVENDLPIPILGFGLPASPNPTKFDPDPRQAWGSGDHSFGMDLHLMKVLVSRHRQ